MLDEYDKQFIRSLVYALIVDVHRAVHRLSAGVLDRVLRREAEERVLLLILLPFFVSFVIRTVQWKFILADNGIIFGPLKNLGLLPETFHVLSTPVAVIAGITYNFLPFTALPLYVALERIDKRLVEAAKDLYANKVEAFRKVVLPLSFPGRVRGVPPHLRPGRGRLRELPASWAGRTTTMIGQIIQTQFLDEPTIRRARRSRSS